MTKTAILHSEDVYLRHYNGQRVEIIKSFYDDEHPETLLGCDILLPDSNTDYAYAQELTDFTEVEE